MQKKKKHFFKLFSLLDHEEEDPQPVAGTCASLAPSTAPLDPFYQNMCQRFLAVVNMCVGVCVFVGGRVS